MSLAVGATVSKDMGFDGEKRESGEKSGVEREESMKRSMSESSLYTTEDDDEVDENNKKLELGPQYTIKEQLEKDKSLSLYTVVTVYNPPQNPQWRSFVHWAGLYVFAFFRLKDDESLRRWKEKLLGSVDMNNGGELLEPEVKIISLSILSPGRPDMVLPIPENGKPKGSWFTLKEGSKYRLKFSFQVTNNIVSGFKYTNTVWKTGVKVDNTKEMLGTFSPQQESYTYEMPEETTPSGFFARGSYSAKSKFVDDDGKCYLEINYSFDIRKDWAAL